ncbi:MAG TPA: nucleoside recognition domain-containing protein [bacterium]|nr:nucleoside recognition domain-containing protein [bacterium]HPR86828.1 nucleoside recognition domain-containing protein [bacterium]
MMNYVWFALVAIAFVVGAVQGNIEAVTKGALDSASTAVNIAIGLIGIMTMWLGIMKIAEEAGLVRILSRAIKPVSKRLFPDIPSDHPAIGAIVLNISANWLGLSNAATPMGLKAMEQLQSLNPKKESASDAMITFLALNTGSITLIPMTVIAVRAGLGSTNPTEIIGSTIFASCLATLTGVLAAKTFITLDAGRNHFKATLRRSWRPLLIMALAVAAAAALAAGGVFSALAAILPANGFRTLVTFISTWAIPFLLFFIPLFAFIKKIKVYEVFIDGAKEGFQVAVRIIPFLVAILVAIGMFRASGAMQTFIYLLTPLTNLIGMPAEVLPAALMRPLSGSGSLGIITELLKNHGPDSLIGRMASTIYGCSETTFYVVAVYFGSVQIKNIRSSIWVGLIADLAGILGTVFICRYLFL